MDPALARQLYERNRDQNSGRRVTAAAQPYSIVPAKQWQELRRRLDEEAKRTAKLLLNRTELRPEGRELPFKLKPGIGANSNFVAAFQMVNEKIAKIAGGKKRQEWSAEEFSGAIARLPEILNGLVREVKGLQNAKG
jgi:DNA repair protein RadD